MNNATQAQEKPKVRYCLYARKSTEAEERQALSIDSQIKEMERIAERDNLEIVDIRRESHSAKESGQRPVFKQLLEDIRKNAFNGLLTWAPDRLSRNAGDLGELVDLMDRQLLIEIKTYTQVFTNSPNEKFLLMILGSQAKLENDNRGVNVQRGLRTRVEMGLWPGTAPTGYVNEKRTDRKCQVLVDPHRGPIVRKMFEKVAFEQWSGRKLYQWLKEDMKFTTRNGKPLTLSNIYILLRNPFYTGTFEYPKESGNWYTGKHSPLIDKDVFDKVQTQLTRHFDSPAYGSKEFAFTRLIICGLCGSGITAMEKIKRQKNGNEHRYIYYGCTRSRDKFCKREFVREEDLIDQLVGIVETLKIDDKVVEEKIKYELERFRKFNSAFGTGPKPAAEQKTIGPNQYLVYVLKEGSMMEKREVLGCLKSRLVLADKQLRLE